MNIRPARRERDRGLFEFRLMINFGEAQSGKSPDEEAKAT